MSTLTRPLEHALALAEKGYRVFPVNGRTKIPYVGAWPDVATSNADQVRAWWANFPHACPGIATGQGLMVLDLDRKQGRDGVAWWQSMNLIFDAPPTMTVRTPSGGFHIYYSVEHDVPTSAGRIAPGVDVRGHRGMVLGPGSVRDGKSYEIVPFEEVLA